MMPFVTYPIVVPSGRAFTTWDVPMLPPAPGRLKITTFSWSVSEKGRETVRARMSPPPPGRKGTTIVICFVCAKRASGAAPEARNAPAS